MRRQPTPQHLTWFLDMRRNNQLQLNPPYQRKSVWSTKDRKFFLDTIFRNYPAPPIFVHRDIDDKGFTTFNVVDGKQRLETIMLFADNKIAISETFGDINLNGKKFNDLPPEYKRKFWDYILIVDFIESIEGTNIDEVFDRVNRNSKNLQPQELRHARFDGWFINEAEDESEDLFWWEMKVSTKAKDRRMKNVQFISELLLIVLENEIVGFSQDYLDEMYAIYDAPEELDESPDIDSYHLKKDQIKAIIKQMNETNNCIALYCKTFTNFYSLWALIAEKYTAIQNVEQFASNYSAFMENVQRFENPEFPISSALDYNGNNHHIYFLNSKGASTELPQRKNRHNSLSIILTQ